MIIVDKSAPENGSTMPAGGNAMDIREDVALGEGMGENLVDETILGLAFDEKMQTDQRPGLPPTTFFSHSSDSV
jgi:hypothetical protein